MVEKCGTRYHMIRRKTRFYNRKKTTQIFVKSMILNYKKSFKMLRKTIFKPKTVKSL